MKNFALYCILVIFALLLCAGIIEKYLHRRRLEKIPIRILVNGTRGKTSVTRLLAAALRESGVRTWAKTTGSQAVWILPDGSETEYRKNRPVSIREQIPFVRRAAQNGAQAVVVECMALHPENQKTMASELVRPGIVVITNARVDHVSEIGATEEETVSTLSLSIPTGAQVIADDPRFDEYTNDRISALNVNVEQEYADSFDYPVFEDNIRLVLKTCEVLGIDRAAALNGMKKARPDAGMVGPFEIGGSLIVNGFAANDHDSALMIYRENHDRTLHASKPVRVLYNNRADREFRLREFAGLIREINCEKITVIGDNREKAAAYLERKTGVPAETVSDLAAYLQSVSKEKCMVFCVGNIKGEGMRLIEILMNRRGDI